jgi:enoyl-CoA hydratase/carnithine racemase
MGECETIEIVQDGTVDWLTLNRPERLNAIDGRMVEELSNYFSDLQNDYSRRVVVMRGAGRGFCAGLDLTWFQESGGGSLGGSDEDEGPDASLAGVVLKMRSCPQPIISLVHGAACGGGFNFVLASDIRIAGVSAKMNVTFVKLGLSGCELGTSFFLPRLVGGAVASELMMTGRFLNAQRALSVGLVSQVVEDHRLEDAARDLLTDMLAVSPIGLRKTKETLGRAAEMSNLAAVIALEERTQLACMQSGRFADAASKLKGKSAG